MTTHDERHRFRVTAGGQTDERLLTLAERSDLMASLIVETGDTVVIEPLDGDHGRRMHVMIGGDEATVERAGVAHPRTPGYGPEPIRGQALRAVASAVRDAIGDADGDYILRQLLGRVEWLIDSGRSL